MIGFLDRELTRDKWTSLHLNWLNGESMNLWLFRLASGALGFFITICLAWASPEAPGLLIISYDAEQDSLSRQDSGFRNVAKAVADDMLALGFRIFDDSTLRIEGTFEENQGWTKGSMIGVGRMSRLRDHGSPSDPRPSPRGALG